MLRWRVLVLLCGHDASQRKSTAAHRRFIAPVESLPTFLVAHRLLTLCQGANYSARCICSKPRARRAWGRAPLWPGGALNVSLYRFYSSPPQMLRAFLALALVVQAKALMGELYTNSACSVSGR